PDGHRNFDFNVVAFAVEERMLRYFGGDVEIARRRTPSSGVAFARHAQAGATARAWRNADVHQFGARHASIAAAGGAGVAQPSAAVASRASKIEPHGPRHLADVAGPLALRAVHFARARRTRPVASATDFVTVDVEPRLRPLDGLPEIDVHHVFEVAALLRFRLVCRAVTGKELREDVAEAAARLRAPPA